MLIPRRRALARALDPATNRPKVRAVSEGYPGGARSSWAMLQAMITVKPPGTVRLVSVVPTVKQTCAAEIRTPDAVT